MKKMSLIILLFVTVICSPHNVFAERVYDVRYTVHNLSNNTDPSKGLVADQRQFMAWTAGADQVCIFCHTPHNASPSTPLWNKVYDPATAATYRLYTSSATLSATAKAASITANSESMLCLSCHDGKTAVNVLHNSRVREGSVLATGDAIIDFGIGFNPTDLQAMGDLGAFGGVYPSNLGATRNESGGIVDALDGKNLADDHPIGFSYNAVRDEGTNSNDLNTIDYAKGKGLRFFGPNRDRVECSSCHNPHVFYGYGLYGGARQPIAGATQAQIDRTPFLVRDNIASALCLGCHIK